jgi:hypothetical protein
MRNTIHHIVILLLLATTAWTVLVTTALAEDISIQASLQPTGFTVDQSARLTITVTGTSSASPEEPHGDGLQFFSQGQSTQMQWINGKSSSSVSFSYLVQAVSPGTHTIEPVTIDVDGTTYRTKAITCKVEPVATTPAPQSGHQGGKAVRPPSATRLRSGEADRIGFMRILPKKELVYAGELLPFTVKAYFRQGMRVTIKSAPRLANNSFILESLDKKPVQSEEIINGTPYTLLTWNGAVSAVKQGEFPLEVEMDVSLLVRSRRQPSSMFGSPLFNDPFFDDFFSGYTQKDITLISEKQAIDVKDLPEKGKPAEFTGAIGSFSLAVKAQPTVVQTGDPITLKMIIQGSGNFGRVQAPVFTGNGNDWKAYPPSAGNLEHTEKTTKKKFEQAIIPTRPSVRQLPPVVFAYFNPDSEKYIRLHSDPIAISMKEDSAAVPKRTGPPTIPPQYSQQPTQPAESVTDTALVPIHTRFGKGVDELQLLYQKLWFQLLIAIALILLLTALVLLRRKSRLAGNPELVEKKKLTRKIETLLIQAQEAMQTRDSRSFLTISRQILQQRFGLAWQVEPQAICAADLERRLGADSPLVEIFNKTEHTMYTGEELSTNEMEHILQIVREEVQQL